MLPDKSLQRVGLLPSGLLPSQRTVAGYLQPLVGEQIAHAEQRRADLAVFVDRLTAALPHPRRCRPGTGLANPVGYPV